MSLRFPPLAERLRTILVVSVAWNLPCHATSGDEVALDLGADFQAIIDAHPAGTHYVVGPGVHRAARLIPKDGDIISGSAGAVLNGCVELPDWRREGDWWVHDVPELVPESSPVGVFCSDMICLQTQDLYIDDERLYAARSLAEVWDEGRWFLDRQSRRVLLRRDPTGRCVELGGPSPVAIDCSPAGLPPRQGVVIEDLRIEKYPTPPQKGAVRLGGNSVCRRCDIRQAHSYGVQLTGAATVQDCYLFDNGMCGIGGTGIGAVIEGCELAHNVWGYYAGPAWDNGGMKIAGSADTTIRRCYVHHNHGPGIWTDIRSHDVVVEDNIIEFNDWEGILFEISTLVTARRNVCRWNGVAHRGALWGAQICVQNSNHATIESNFLECGPDGHSQWGSGQGVMAINQNDRAWDEGVFGGDFSVRNIAVHHNVILLASAGHSGIDYGTLGWDSYEDFLAAGLSWHDNRYLAAQPLGLRWSWRLADRWQDTVAQWFGWEGWSGYQDAGSILETFGPNRYQPTGTDQWEVMKQATGHDYPALKAGLIRRPAPSTGDHDGDGLPDVWERTFFGSSAAAAGADDTDGDGWDNARELLGGTHPGLRDTDFDGLPDPGESSPHHSPTVFDSAVDVDLDGRSAREEFEDGTDPLVAQPLDQPVPESHLSLWLETVTGPVTRTDGALESWTEHSRHRRAIGWEGTPAMDGTSPTGWPLVNPGSVLVCPGGAGFWGDGTTGFTMVLAFQPTSIDVSGTARAVLTNEVHLHAGFRLRLEAGYMVLSSGQSGGTLVLAGHTRLEAGRTYIISINSAAPGGRHALYLDGAIEAWKPDGRVVPSENPLVLGGTGGVTPQPGRFGDVAVFDRELSHLERRTVESLLRQKFQTGFVAGTDRDLDGMSDAYEAGHRTDPATPDGAGDEDRDGAGNLSELRQATDPQVPDTDGDGMGDGWEIDHGIDPLVLDGGGDADADGVSNLAEFEEGTHPRQAMSLPPALEFTRLRVWWRSDTGLTAAGQQVSRWADSSARGNDGVPVQGTDGPAVSADPWQGRASILGSSSGALASGDVDLRTVHHQSGVTLITAIRAPSAPGTPGVFNPVASVGGFAFGAIEGKPAFQSSLDGALVAAAAPLAAGAHIVALTLPVPPAKARLYADGQLVAEASGLPPFLITPVQLGGLGASWPVEVSEIAVFAGVLPSRERVVWARMLEGKWRGTGSLAGDSDGDGLPDWWEWEAAGDPASADPQADADFDGIPNISAFHLGMCGFTWSDHDHDGMQDGWEEVHGLDPQSGDADLDPDSDGRTNAIEHAMGTEPGSGANPPGAWGVTLSGDSSGPEVRLRFSSNRRSWRFRVGVEESRGIEPGSWRLLTTPDPLVPIEAGISQLLVPVGPASGGPPASYFRLRLLDE